MDDQKYGNIPLESLKLMISMLSGFENLESNLETTIKEAPPEKKDELFGKNFSWVRLYRHKFYKNFLSFIVVTGLLSLFKKKVLKNTSNDYSEFFDELEQIKEFKGGWFGLFKEKHMLERYYPILKSLESMMLYGTTINRLMARAVAGNDKAFFDAVRVDRTLISYPGMVARITRAELEDDTEFFKRLRNALEAKKGRYIEYGVLRYILAVLHLTGQLDNLTQKEAYELLAEELRLYPQTGEEPEKSLWQFISRFKKEIDLDMNK